MISLYSPDSRALDFFEIKVVVDTSRCGGSRTHIMSTLNILIKTLVGRVLYLVRLRPSGLEAVEANCFNFVDDDWHP